jgi:hypothetical protein
VKDARDLTARDVRWPSLCEELRGRCEEIVELWNTAIEREPWILGGELARPDFVPELVECIADATLCDPPSRRAMFQLADTAARHATARAIAGADHPRVVLEYYVLRNAIWAFFRERKERETPGAAAILHVDMAISVATRAALIGYYRSQFEAQGEWPGALDRLVDEIPLVWTVEE